MRLVSEVPEVLFVELISELCDGERWKLIRAQSWDEFVERLSETIVQLSPRRRQAAMMLLLALTEGLVTPEEAQAWIQEHPPDADEAVEEIIRWLRQFRPR